MLPLLITVGLALTSHAGELLAPGTEKDAKAFAAAIDKVNAAHARKPGETHEDELASKLPKKARAALERVLESEDLEALERCSDAALELALVADFGRLRARRAELAPADAARLPVALARERFLLIGENGLTSDYLEHFAEVFDDVLTAYDEVFGFAEFSKIPGKKLRVRVHLEDAITRPPHFAPQFDWHSEIDFPVIDAERLRSPTQDGKFLFFGLCHELGHVIAMWGPGPTSGPDQDHHAWADYTGYRIVEHLNERKGRKPDWLKHATDYRWRNLAKERKAAEDVEPSLDDRSGVLSLLLRLDELVGPRAIGDAFNLLDEQDDRTRVNHVRYYTFEELERALLKTLGSKKQRKAVAELFG
jgi:hypothetical protein